MKFRSVLLALLCALPCASFAADPVKAVTTDGRTVLLRSDGTWIELNGNSKASSSNARANTLYQTDVPSYAFLYDQTEWNPDKPTKSGRQDFKTKKEGYFGAVIAEAFPVGMENLKKIALANARKASPTAEVIQDESRVINGTRVQFMKFRGPIEGIDFVFYGNYYADDAGILQVVCGTIETVDQKSPQRCPDFINGLKIK